MPSDITVRVEPDLDFLADSADPVDPADILETLEPALDDIVHEPGKLLQRHAGSRRRIALDRLAFDIDPLDDRFVDRARQIHAILATASLTSLTVGIDLKPELDRGQGRSVGDGRGDMLDAGDVGDRVLDLLGDLRLKPAGAEPDWFTVTATTGTSMLGKRVIGSIWNETMPSSMTTAKKTSAGTGVRIDQAETLSDMAFQFLLRGCCWSGWCLGLEHPTGEQGSPGRRRARRCRKWR